MWPFCMHLLPLIYWFMWTLDNIYFMWPFDILMFMWTVYFILPLRYWFMWTLIYIYILLYIFFYVDHYFFDYGDL